MQNQVAFGTQFGIAGHLKIPVGMISVLKQITGMQDWLIEQFYRRFNNSPNVERSGPGDSVIAARAPYNATISMICHRKPTPATATRVSNT
jgi:hypothetical protein